MSVPPLHFSHSFDSYTSGEVIVHPSAVIAPGVILLAAPNSKIIIGLGVCIGTGSILEVHEGTIEVEAGAMLGSGFLMIGEGKIGANACIGSATTVFNCSVEPGQVVPPNSILGDTSRSIAATDETTEATDNLIVEAELENNSSATPTTESPVIEPPVASTATPTIQETKPPAIESPNNSGSAIYGQVNIQRLLITLFPHRQSSTTPKSDEPSE
ncbi:transferase [Aetokthonos hydrillicola Thurmond2011]|jgi:carbon dioxide concentrating mechanism protein CcmN|uniref:Transferase n=1 Tax=Aetokthonos hydrillicola Thurmond2011 TaxID=2712845 RepID=A0AAP5I752_9CYAN|nr:transferase [Aetokthonos hydrillicola]MBO3457699.1 transferase [Aetokthonos hydrillicola CCALA 1050]MBW4590875.1 transferase [Aetokthonos hydrillicola CCALA 1050]MDR9896212.1 transferase [Aetokthonos hydrillicola Thurmond2011]